MVSTKTGRSLNEGGHKLAAPLERRQRHARGGRQGEAVKAGPTRAVPHRLVPRITAALEEGDGSK
jgi:hypothetical protein